jgi:hypothetical protein
MLATDQLTDPSSCFNVRIVKGVSNLVRWLQLAIFNAQVQLYRSTCYRLSMFCLHVFTERNTSYVTYVQLTLRFTSTVAVALMHQLERKHMRCGLVAPARTVALLACRRSPWRNPSKKKWRGDRTGDLSPIGQLIIQKHSNGQLKNVVVPHPTVKVNVLYQLGHNHCTTTSTYVIPATLVTPF